MPERLTEPRKKPGINKNPNFYLIIELLYTLQVSDMGKFEGISLINLFSNFGIHSISVRLIYEHAFFGEGRGVVNWHIVQLRMLCPVFIKNELLQDL